MKKLRASILKEAILLSRDIEGVVILFIMPLILVIVTSLLQDRTFQNLSETKIPTVFVNFDKDSLGVALKKGINESRMFEVTEIKSIDSIALEKARQDVAHGKYQVGIFVPANATQAIKNRAIGLVHQQLPNAIKADSSHMASKAQIRLFFDPVTKESFKDMTKSALSEFSARIETKLIFEAYSKVIDALINQTSNVKIPDEPVISFKEELISEYTEGVTPNVVQHSIPAWTLFGMFLICIPIAGNIIKERNEGCMARLKTIPVTYLTIMIGKVIVFVGVCLFQALLIVLAGMFLMPVIDLPELQIHGNWLAVFSISLACALAATGYGIAIGTIATTHIQASTFGAVSSVVFAAVGGVWVPVIIMSEVMRKISEFSPMNWGIQGYYKVFLRSAGTLEIQGEIYKLLAFSAFCIIISLLLRKYRSSG